MTNYSQRYSTSDSSTAGSFYFDTITAVDYPASKVLWGAEGAVNHCSAANPLPVTAVNGGTFAVQAAQTGTWNITNVSGTVSLPTGASTAAKQPALGTAGTASSDVITVQGIASMTALKVDGSAVTQPVSVASAISAKIQDGSGNAITSAARGSERAVTVQIVDASGNQITSFGGSGGTASNYGSAFPSSGTATGWSDGTNMQGPRVFDADTGAGTQYVAGANLRISGSGGSIEAKGSQTSANSIPVVIASDQGSLTVAATCTNAGTFAVQATCTNAGTFAVQAACTIGAAASNIAKAEDAASADADVGVPAMAVRKATPANTSGTDGDYEMLQMSAGRLWTSATIDAALPAGTNGIGKLTSNSGVTIGAVEIASAQTLATVTTVTTVTTCSTVTTLTGGGVAHDGVDSGNPVKIGVKATTSLSAQTPVASADRTDLFAGADGVLIVREHTNLEDAVQERTTNTDGASTAFASGLAAPGAGIRLCITSVDICNSSASFCTVDLRDGAAGSVLWTLPVPATGGVCKNFAVPLKLTANTALAFDASAATSTLTISANGYKSKL